MVATPAFAQGTPPADAAASDSDVIVVTGSLIRNPNLTASSPVASVGENEISLRQTTNAEQLIRNIPGVVPSLGANVNNGNNGTSQVDLRGLGEQRNIVLLDGKRIIPADSDGAVDLNNIPVALVSRVDVLTGGASTTYGADAISGVVNFVTRADFSGMDLQVQNGITEKGDGHNIRVDMTVGANFDDGRGNAVLSLGYQQSDPIYQGDRDSGIFGISTTTGVASGSSFTSTPTAISASGGDFQINPAGTAFVPFYQGFNFNPYNIYSTPFERFNMYGAARYEVSDSIEVYSRGMFSKNKVSTIVAPSGIFGVGYDIPRTNPYLTPALQTQLCTIGGITCTPTTITIPAVYRRTVEIGPRVSEYVTQQFDINVGAKFNITDTLSFDLYGSHGESENQQTQSGYVLNSRVQQALNATNTTSCVNTANSCVPLNLFGTITPAQAAFLNGSSTITNKTELSQVHGVLSGDFGFTSPAASDPIAFAAGAEYRNYVAKRIPDILALVPGELGGAGGAVLPLSGGYDVREAFGEIIAPLVSDKPFFHELTAEAGVRYSKYKVDAAGSPKFSATTWKVGGTWAPVEDFKIRGNYQRAVRAPSISELFAPVVTSLTNLNRDPCAGAAPTTNANLAAICRAQGAPAASVAAGSIQTPSAGQANYTGGGNPNLQPEKANTYTIGVVLQPREFLPNFTMTVDYYNIDIKNAITRATPDDVLNACFGNITAASATSAACTGIRRNVANGRLSGTSTAANPIPGLPSPRTNLGRLKTDGIDLALNYTYDFDVVKLGLNFQGNWTHKNVFQASSTAYARDCVGYYSANCESIQPEYSFTQRTTLSFDSVDVSLFWRWIDKVEYEGSASDFVARGFTAANRRIFSGTVTGPSPLAGNSYDFNRIKAYSLFDLTTRVNVTDNVEVTMAAINLFNKKPPIVGSTTGSTAFNSGNTYPSTYDAIGRRYSVTARLKF
ncbi:TonB-dependent receptor [Sphingomonas montanisoli]|uniref:TonB-dependent receptor n=2 Tax=Sphingomonas montanisoli TaxID=2606412 RepID=A0A5D9C6C0_9SPHN|nr:TonB-dependent receptor [Sphingomonas montanisoli]TZG26590.1 TonB-dependent receptor [Sphingomonas montanisoli]